MVDEAAFREFAQARTPPLHRAAFLLCGNHHEAEDLVQETLAKVYVAWGRRGVDNPAAYARTVLTRTFISSRRKASSTERPTEWLPETATVGSDTAALMDLMDELRALAPVDRAVVVMRYLDDASVRDTAQALKLSEQAVRTRSSRALARLRTVLSAGVDDVAPIARGGTR
ncbi:SigE family RNA polymerase sigma factor [Nocardioides yefusunii]|uniref:SigE family RNA polymerase sigma factor n=1 Tax=Nocardioides yefusunii TaxID=2500546 RepID=A0ABW1R0L3_9ACTN|nr:SigE family RNA polymerase sigma factor [Nocardioides yefusunii]